LNQFLSLAYSIRAFTTENEWETEELGKRIGFALQTGATVALKGPFGSGKTRLAKGIAAALGVKEMVASPSYSIVNEYEGEGAPFYHIDAYRLSGAEDFIDMGGEEYWSGQGVCVIEWPQTIESLLPKDAVFVEIFLEEPLNIQIEKNAPFEKVFPLQAGGSCQTSPEAGFKRFFTIKAPKDGFFFKKFR
jgi:tRNA threonylcarbamoyladenosine biosynthesis protein TsaE